MAIHKAVEQRKNLDGPTAIAMAVSSLLGREVTPKELATLAVNNNHRTKNDGTSHAFYAFAPLHYGLSSEAVTGVNGIEKVKAALRNKDAMVVAAVYGPSHMTGFAHMELITGLITEDGVDKFIVQDPNTNFTYSNEINKDGALQKVYFKLNVKSIFKIKADVLDTETYGKIDNVSADYYRNHRSEYPNLRYWIIKK